MFKFKMLAAVAGVAVACGAASAQYPVYPQYTPVYPSYPAYPQVVYPPPSVPLVVTPNTPIGVNPLTGGIDTSNLQINSSAYDPGRDAARFNGTMRPVDRPIYDPFGNVVGRQTGVEWYNPITGRMNGQVNNLTPNGSGGVHNQLQVYAPNPMAGRPSGPAQLGPAGHLPHRR